MSNRNRGHLAAERLVEKRKREGKTPSPQIIRNRAELRDADPDTLAFSNEYFTAWPTGLLYPSDLPAVLVATGEQVRAARKALKEATE